MTAHTRQHPPLTRDAFTARVLVSAALAALVVSAYWGIWQHDFVHYDDWTYITENPHVLSGLSWGNAVWAFTTGHTANWHPLTWLSHQVDVDVFGTWAGGHHLVTLMLHAVNTVLLFWVLGACYEAAAHGMAVTPPGDTPSAGRRHALLAPALVAGLFGLHPAHVESVAWASERKDVLCGLFWILAMGSYVRYARLKRETLHVAEAAPRTQRTRYPFQVTTWYVATLACFVLALMSKPMAVTLPFVLLMMDRWPLGRCDSPATGWSARGEKPVTGTCSGGRAEPTSAPASSDPLRVTTCQRLLLEKLPFFALAALACVITLRAQGAGGAVASTAFLSGAARFTNAVVAYADYLRMLVLPFHLAVFYPLPVDGYPLWKPVGACLLLGLVTGAILCQSRRRPALAFGWLWFIGTLVPVIGFVKVGMQALADRYTYLPYIGLFIMAATFVTDSGSWAPSRTGTREAGVRQGLGYVRRSLSRYALPVTSLLLLACAILTHRQLGYWRNSLTLADRALAVTRDNEIAHIIAGNYWVQQQDPVRAIGHYEEAVRLGPDSALSLYNLAALYEQTGRVSHAIRTYARVLRLNPDYEKAHLNLGRLYHLQGNVGSAMEQYREVLRINSANPMAHHNLSVVLESLGDREGAIQSERRALQAKPDYANARAHLEQMLMSAPPGEAPLP